MTRPGRLLLLMLAVTAAAVLAACPAEAAWSVGSVNWTYANTSHVDQAVVVGGVVVGQRCNAVTNGDAWLVLCIWGGVSEGNPIRVQHTFTSDSQLKASLVLVGAAPPPKPTQWSQHSYVEGQWYLRIQETENVGGSFDADSRSYFGAPAPPPGANVCIAHELHSDGSDSDVSTGGWQYGEEQNWFSRPAGTAYKAAFVRAQAQIDYQGWPGQVKVTAETWKRDWGIATMPGPVYWAAP